MSRPVRIREEAETSRRVEGRFLRLQGRRVRLLDAGEGEPVVLLHGVGGWAEHWRDVIPALASAGYRALACDLPGFGHSEAPDAVQYFDPADPYYVRFLRELLDALGLTRVTLVGHSLGGAISMVSTACMPQRVDRLVLVAPGGFGDLVPTGWRALSASMAARFGPRLPPAALCSLLPARMVHGIVRSNFHDPAQVPPWLLEDALSFARAGAAVEVTRVLRQLLGGRGPRGELKEAWHPKFAELRCPTLLVWGREDRTVPCEHADVARSLIPGARLELIDEAGHLVMLEKHESFARVLMGFLGAEGPDPGTPH
ncbi:MAG: alpha/beta fold hydrolase [Myxococcaceae bacterium]|nr:alpha/beta fold hydrolase [Myxococcaceae bacterium]